MGIQILHNVEAGKIKIREAGECQREAGYPLRETRIIRGRRLRQGGVRAI